MYLEEEDVSTADLLFIKEKQLFNIIQLVCRPISMSRSFFQPILYIKRAAEIAL